MSTSTDPVSDGKKSRRSKKTQAKSQGFEASNSKTPSPSPATEALAVPAATGEGGSAPTHRSVGTETEGPYKRVIREMVYGKSQAVIDDALHEIATDVFASTQDQLPFRPQPKPAGMQVGNSDSGQSAVPVVVSSGTSTTEKGVDSDKHASVEDGATSTASKTKSKKGKGPVTLDTAPCKVRYPKVFKRALSYEYRPMYQRLSFARFFSRPLMR